jgi:hypothetical protein
LRSSTRDIEGDVSLIIVTRRRRCVAGGRSLCPHLVYTWKKRFVDPPITKKTQKNADFFSKKKDGGNKKFFFEQGKIRQKITYSPSR